VCTLRENEGRRGSWWGVEGVKRRGKGEGEGRDKRKGR